MDYKFTHPQITVLKRILSLMSIDYADACTRIPNRNKDNDFIMSIGNDTYIKIKANYNHFDDLLNIGEYDETDKEILNLLRTHYLNDLKKRL